MTTALPSSDSSASVNADTVSLTQLRCFVQSRAHDPILLDFLTDHFDPIPAEAMLKHRLPRNSWRTNQISGATFHDDLVTAVEAGVSPATAAPHLRSALRILQQFHFQPVPKVTQLDDCLFSSDQMGIRGKADLIGYLHDRPALIEIKTVHEIPHDYAFVEHSLQAAALFALAWQRAPRVNSDSVAILYVTSTAPHRAFLRSVQLPHRFVGVATKIASHLLGRN